MKPSPRPLFVVTSYGARRCWVRVYGDATVSGVVIEQVRSCSFQLQLCKGNVWAGLSQPVRWVVSLVISESWGCSCLHALSLSYHAWGWYGAHPVHLPDHPKVCGCLWQMVLSFSLYFLFLPVSHWRQDSVLWINTEQWQAPVGSKGWGVLCKYMQIQALQNSLSSPFMPDP